MQEQEKLLTWSMHRPPFSQGLLKRKVELLINSLWTKTLLCWSQGWVPTLLRWCRKENSTMKNVPFLADTCLPQT